MGRTLDGDAGRGDAVAEEDDGQASKERGPTQEGLDHGAELAGDDLGLAVIGPIATAGAPRPPFA
eukprot:6980512-Lingulodinium_polyedra.AAC.1